MGNLYYEYTKLMMWVESIFIIFLLLPISKKNSIFWDVSGAHKQQVNQEMLADFQSWEVALLNRFPMLQQFLAR